MLSASPQLTGALKKPLIGGGALWIWLGAGAGFVATILTGLLIGGAYGIVWLFSGNAEPWPLILMTPFGIAGVGAFLMGIPAIIARAFSGYLARIVLSRCRG